MNRDLETRIVACINSALNYLRSGSVSSKIVGMNVSEDTSREFDLVAEDILVSCIVNTLNDVVVVSEERGVRRYGEGRWIAIIDPVDGSTNFDAEIPWSSVSIALARSSGESSTTLKDIVFAVVAEVFRDRMYIYRDGAVEVLGGGATRRSTPKPILLGYFETIESYRPVWNYMKVRGRVALRSLGSAALDIIYVGLGNAEGFIDMRSRLRNVDVAAALRIALTMGAGAHLCSVDSVANMQLENIAKVGCIVAGYNDGYLTKLLEAIQTQSNSTESNGRLCI